MHHPLSVKLDALAERFSKRRVKASIQASVEQAAALVAAAFGGTHVMVKDLPASVQKALASVRYKKRDIKISPATSFRLQSFGGDGVRDFTLVVDLKTGQFKSTYGSWGGPNPYTNNNPTDLDDTKRPLPDGVLVIQGSEGGGRPVYASILVNPATLTPLLPAGGDAELSKEEAAALNIIGGLITFARIDEFERGGLGKYGPENEHVKSLAAKGLVKIASNGAIGLTLAGKNARNW